MNIPSLASNPWALLALPAAMYVALAAAVARRQSWTGEIKLAVAGTGVVLIAVWLMSFAALMAFFLAAYVERPLNALGPVAVDGEMAVGTVVWIAVGQAGERLAEVRTWRDAVRWLLSPRPYVALLVAVSAALSSVANAVHPLTAAAGYHLPAPWSYAGSAVPGVVMFAVIHQLVILFRVLRSPAPGRHGEVIDVDPAVPTAAGGELAELRSELRALTERLGAASPVTALATADGAGDDRTDDQAAPAAPVIERSADAAPALIPAASPLTVAMTAASAEGDRHVAGLPAGANGHDPVLAAVVERPPAGHDAGHEPVMTGLQARAGGRPSDGHAGGHTPAAATATGGPADDPAEDRVDGHEDDRGAAVEETAPRAAAAVPLTKSPLEGTGLDGNTALGDSTTSMTAGGRAAGHDDDRRPAAVMTAEEARAAAVRLVRQARRSGRAVTPADVQRVTGRKARQARRLLAQALAAVEETPARRPRVVEVMAAAPPAAREA